MARTFAGLTKQPATKPSSSVRTLSGLLESWVQGFAQLSRACATTQSQFNPARQKRRSRAFHHLTVVGDAPQRNPHSTRLAPLPDSATLARFDPDTARATFIADHKPRSPSTPHPKLQELT
jgi:hypothetical protein